MNRNTLWICIIFADDKLACFFTFSIWYSWEHHHCYI